MKAKVLIGDILNKKVTVHKLQRICGFLNFLGRSVVLGHAFTRRLYSAYAGNTNLKAHHHINISREMRLDLTMWKIFINHPCIFSRKFIDFAPRLVSDISFYTDASKSIGFGGYCGTHWMHAKWNPQFIKEYDPSIAYLELYAVTA